MMKAGWKQPIYDDLLILHEILEARFWFWMHFMCIFSNELCLNENIRAFTDKCSEIEEMLGSYCDLPFIYKFNICPIEANLSDFAFDSTIN